MICTKCGAERPSRSRMETHMRQVHDNAPWPGEANLGTPAPVPVQQKQDDGADTDASLSGRIAEINKRLSVARAEMAGVRVSLDQVADRVAELDKAADAPVSVWASTLGAVADEMLRHKNQAGYQLVARMIDQGYPR